MTDLTIRRLSATVDAWPDPDHVPRMLRGLADSRLRDAVREHALPAGEWCLRRLDVDLVLDPARPASALEVEWADQIVIALRRSLRDGSADLVRYDRREQALDDLLAGLAAGDHERAWAWRQVGVLLDADPDPAAAPRELALRVLTRLPHGVAAAVHRLVDRVGVAATHRLLGGPGWVAAAVLAARQAGASLPATPSAIGHPSDDRTGSRSDEGASEGPREGADDAQDLPRTATLAAGSSLATALRGSSLRPDAATLEAWAVLVLARSQPTALRGPGVGSVLQVLAAALRPSSRAGLGEAAPARVEPARPGPGSPPGSQESPQAHPMPHAAGTTTPPGTPGTAPTTEARQEPDSTDPTAAPAPAGSQAQGVRTPWGGLLFLLNTAAEAGLPEALDAPPLESRPQWWLLRELATRVVPAGRDDAAVLAFSGTDPQHPDDQPPPRDPEAADLDLLATQWVGVTAARVRPDDRTEARDDVDDLHLVRTLARRDALVLSEPGWVEVVLDLDDVDLDVRRAGLDLDPGWVWWLGQVVRFRYE